MKIYCSGIGGIGLSAYASLQRAVGHNVSGSDRTDSSLLEELKEQGITIFLIQDGSHIPEDTDLFVYTEALPEDHPERLRAKELGIRSINYFEALGELSAPYTVIAVCGTHGKSSTTAMAALVLTNAGLDPTVVVGTKVPDLDNKNWRKGGSDIFLVEACEYRRDFLHLKPNIILMTNVDGDHFDAFGSVEAYQKTFSEFLALLPPDGLVITHGKNADCERITKDSGKRVINADEVLLPELSIPGVHMQQNAQLAEALGVHLGIDPLVTRSALKAYKGSWRRMEVKGTIMDDVLVIDDYGHHPVEIRAVLQALGSAYPSRRLVVVFQPHTHDRTKTLFSEFTSAFTGVDTVIIPNIYEARGEVDRDKVNVDVLVQEIATHSGANALNGHSLLKTKEMLLTGILQPHDVLVCMGAGDITSLASELMQEA